MHTCSVSGLTTTGTSRRTEPIAALARLAHHGAPSLPGVVVLGIRARPDIRRAVDPVVLGSGVRSASCSSRRMRPATASLVIGGSA